MAKSLSSEEKKAPTPLDTRVARPGRIINHVKLWVDDRRRAPRGWTRAINVAEAQTYLATGGVEEASLDHDLGACNECMGGMSTDEWLETHDWDMPTCEHIGTGYTLCVWMERTGHWPKQKPKVHSMNQRGSVRMREIIDRRFGSAEEV